MATRIPEELIDQVRNSFNIVDVIGQYVHLKKSGRSYMGLCPFHSEKTPSFSVLEDKQIFHCFGCGAGGNLVSFVMRVEALDFLESIRLLADRAGILLPDQQEEERGPDQKVRSEKQIILQAYELVAKLYTHMLFHQEFGREAMEYVAKRQIQKEAMETFQLGFAPDDWRFITHFLEKRGFDLSLMNKAGLLAKRESNHNFFDLFRNRLIFPIADTQGRIVAFGGRILGEGHPKYLNSPEHPLFNKSKVLFNLYQARTEIRQKQVAVLFEGYMDVLSAWQAGVKNGVASLGTSLTEHQAKIIRRYAEEVIVCYDSDRAGIEAAMKASQLLGDAGCRVRIADLGEGLDPDEFIKKYGSQLFNLKLEEAISITSFKMAAFRKRFDLSNEHERMEYITKILRQISTLESAVEREHYLRTLAEEFNYSLDSLKQEQRRIYYQQKKEEKRDKLPNKWNNNINNARNVVVKTLLPAHYNAEKRLITIMLHCKDYVVEIMEKIGGNFNIDEFAALAAHLYHYYTLGNEADPSKFIAGLTDEKLVEKATELAMEEISEVPSSRELSDYIQQVLNFPIQQEIENLKHEQKRLEKEGEVVEAARIGNKILQLRKTIKPVST
jgi:DNA primase